VRFGCFTDSSKPWLNGLAKMRSSPFSVVGDELLYYSKNTTTTKQLAEIVEDLISAPALQAYVENLFSEWHSDC
jgi:hypothetical protein